MTLSKWLLRILTWDGVLPVCILAVPSLVEWLLPNSNVVGLIYVVIAIAAFFARIAVGARHIRCNNCPRVFQHIQFGVFLLAILLLLVLDTAMMAVPIRTLRNEDFRELATLLSVYFVLMVLAMYPGPPKPLPEVLTF
jgi:hypothetical protein